MMKRASMIILLIAALYAILFSGRILLRDNVTDKNELVKIYQESDLKAHKNLGYTKSTYLLKLNEKIDSNTKLYSAILILGAIIFIAMTVIINWSSFSVSKFNSTKRLVAYRLSEVVLNLSYWTVIGVLYFAMQMVVKQKVSECVIDCMFIFYTAGFIGFYSSYYYLTDKFLLKFQFAKYILMCLPIITLASIVAYFIPFYSGGISKISFNTFNGVFIQGFILMSIFIFANVVMGSIIKGFFNWIYILLQNKNTRILIPAT